MNLLRYNYIAALCIAVLVALTGCTLDEPATDNVSPKTGEPLLRSVDDSFDASGFVPIEELAKPVKWEKKTFEEILDSDEGRLRFQVIEHQAWMDWDGDGEQDSVSIRYDDELMQEWLAYLDEEGDESFKPDLPSTQSCMETACVVSFSVNEDLKDKMVVGGTAFDENMDKSFFFRADKGSKQLSFALYESGPSEDRKYFFFSHPRGENHYQEVIGFRDKLYADGYGRFVSSWDVTHVEPNYVFAYYDAQFTNHVLEGNPGNFKSSCGSGTFSAYFNEVDRDKKQESMVDYFDEKFRLDKPKPCLVKRILYRESEHKSVLYKFPAEYYVELADGRKGYLGFFDGD